MTQGTAGIHDPGLMFAARRLASRTHGLGRAPDPAACVLGLVFGLAAWLGPPGTPVARADEPSPTPLVFHTPQYLVWMDGHSTSNGPV
ncbi:MAG TPA: hypothetical protein VLS28_01250, partial [Candidatus Sulfomarinibacteraceae bacterium]|nr:hypothetical protein [Candidatus Sulfomarinibacteraceae bacterium]